MKNEKFRFFVFAGIAAMAFSFTSLASVILRGDINGDGNVDLKDVTVLRKGIVSEGEINAWKEKDDVNHDGSVDLKDITILRRYLAGGWGITLDSVDMESDTADAADPDLSQYELLSSEISPNGIKIGSYVYGNSEQNRDLIVWSIHGDEYERTVLLNFEIHGWEDSYEADGQLLVDLGNTLVEYYGEKEYMGKSRVLIIPSCNPDGLAEGTTNNGFGRCNAKGIDLNRDFDVEHVVYSNARNYTPYPFSAAETRAMRDLIYSVYPDVVIDFHGWENDTIGSGELAEVFSLYTGINHKCEFTSSAHGYFSYWTETQGAQALLVEFKDPDSIDDEKVKEAIDIILTGNYGEEQWSYDLDDRFSDMKPIQTYALTSDRVYTQKQVGDTGTVYGYINGDSDICSIMQIYENGWCKVRYPVDSNGYLKTGYCSFSAFVDPNTEVEHYTANVVENVKVYTTQDASIQLGSVWSTDMFTVIAEEGGMAQIIYPLDEGGYKMGWINSNKIQDR